MNYNFEEINQKVNVAIGVLLKNDAELLKIDVHERSITHKFAEYLQFQFPDWNVDCEYNRKGEFGMKDIHGDIEECTEHKRQYRVFPDIIVHQRKITKCNLLVIEVKKNTSNKKKECDERKLKFFTDPKFEYHYSYGLFVEFYDSLMCKGDWYKDGRANKKFEYRSFC
jgi:hypothetical protein